MGQQYLGSGEVTRAGLGGDQTARADRALLDLS